MEKGIDTLYTYLPRRILKPIAMLPAETVENTTEIRLRLNAPVSLTVGGRNASVSSSGTLCSVSEGICARREDMKECVSLLCSGSLYAVEETLKYGYIPTRGGGRAGICGEAICENGKIKGFSEVVSVNLRLQRHIPLYAESLVRRYKERGLCGTLVFSPPGIGKTTLLRSAAVLLAEGRFTRPYRVALADERRELYGDGVGYGLLDVITGCPKSVAVELLTRTMSPEIIICDELSADDSHGVIEAQNSGVVLICSTHGATLDGVLKRPFIARMYEHGIFSLFVKLSYSGGKYSYEMYDGVNV